MDNRIDSSAPIPNSLSERKKLRCVGFGDADAAAANLKALHLREQAIRSRKGGEFVKRLNRLRAMSTAMMSLAILAMIVTETSSALAAGAGPADPPPDYRRGAPPLTGPSIVKGQKPGIDVGSYPPNFQLQPIQPYADLKHWLGEKAPEKVEDLVMVSDFVGKAPIMLLFGSYT